MWIDYNPNPVQSYREDDCGIRAVAKALGKDWESAFVRLAIMASSMGSTMNRGTVIGAVLRQNGFKRAYPTNECPDCINFEDFASMNPEGTFVVFSQNHVATIVDGDLYDSWDSGHEEVVFVWYKDEEPIFEGEEEE